MSARNFFAIFSVCFVSMGGLAGCAADEIVGESSADLVTFGPGQCNSPTVSTQAQGSGSARTTLSGCVLARQGETGAALVSRAAGVLSDVNRYSTVLDGNGQRLFASFSPHPATGTLATGLVQEVDVTLNEQASPTTRLRFTWHQNADGTFDISVVNATAVTATFLGFHVTAINPGDLSATLKLTPEANGADAVGSSQATLQQGQDHAQEASQLVVSLFDFMKAQLGS
jgi:hypothetical protein